MPGTNRWLGLSHRPGLGAGDGRHAWMMVTVTKLASWDFRKIGRG